jgi:hypothetical protein
VTVIEGGTLQKVRLAIQPLLGSSWGVVGGRIVGTR